MNNQPLSSETLYHTLDKFISAMSRNKKRLISQYYRETKFVISQIKSRNIHEHPDRKIEDDQVLATIENIRSSIISPLCIFG